MDKLAQAVAGERGQEAGMTAGRAAKTPRARSSVDGGVRLHLADFRKIAGLVHGRSRHRPHRGQGRIWSIRGWPSAARLGLRSFRDYCALVAARTGADERQAMIAAMTTNVTRFFRESHHFDHLAKLVLPALAEAARSGRAACGSGRRAVPRAKSPIPSR